MLTVAELTACKMELPSESCDESLYRLLRLLGLMLMPVTVWAPQYGMTKAQCLLKAFGVAWQGLSPNFETISIIENLLSWPCTGSAKLISATSATSARLAPNEQ